MQSINTVLATKRAWAKQRDAEAKALRDIRKALYSHVPYKQESVFSAFMVGACILLAAGILLIGGCNAAHADVIPQEKAIKAIIGEAENQGYTGMLSVACALRNRGTLKGVYGLNAPRVKAHKYSPSTYAMAQKAWLESAKRDITNGATGWGNGQDGIEFAKTQWWKNCVIVYRHKDHFFYREA